MLLIWQLKRGNSIALGRIYEKYRDDLVRIGAGLACDVGTAEDVVQEVFLMLVRDAGKYQISRNLKGYLTSCVVNRIRNLHRGKRGKEHVGLDEAWDEASEGKGPAECVACDEEFRELYRALAVLPYEQREAVVLHVQCRMKFREIAEIQETFIQTSQSRYKYGLNKLRSILHASG